MIYLQEIMETLKINLPLSKSVCNRLLIINSFLNQNILEDRKDYCDDIKVLYDWLKNESNYIDIGACGTAMRFLTALLSIKNGEFLITGSERMRERPIKILVDALRSLGVKIEYLLNEGYPPIKIKGNPKLSGNTLIIQSDVSSQYISALMMIGPYLKGGLELYLVEPINSFAYIKLTAELMKDFGADVKINEEKKQIYIKQGEYKSPEEIRIENDWSAASFWYEMCAVTGAPLTLKGLDYDNDKQGDKIIKDIYKQLGIRTIQMKDSILIEKFDNNIKEFNYDFSNCPDLVIPVVITCLLNDINFNITGIKSLKIKECDRIEALINESKKIGYNIEYNIKEDKLYFINKFEINKLDYNIWIDSYDDHRIVMGFAPAKLKGFNIGFDKPNVVNKSYPNYWQMYNLFLTYYLKVKSKK